MMDDITRRTQRSGSNLHAFRRLKWGVADKRFRFLAHPPRNAVWSTTVSSLEPHILPGPKEKTPEPDTASAITDPISLPSARQRWWLLDLVLIAIIAASCAIIAIKLLW